MGKQLYKCAPRAQNPETFIEIEEVDGNYKTLHHFKGGTVHEEIWTKDDLKEMKEKKLLTKATKIAWSKGELDECQKKPTKKK